VGIIYIAQFHRNFWWVEHVRRKSMKHSVGIGRLGALFILCFCPPEVPNGTIRKLPKNNSELTLRTERLILKKYFENN